MSVGYCTIYGDTAGGLAVIKDCPKMLVYALSRFRTSLRSADDACEKGSDGCSDALGRFLLGPPGPVIPDRILIKEPSAELRPNQKDSDSLPPYDILDGILKRYVEEDQSPQEIVAVGFDPQVVQRVIRMVDRAEYKRRQAPPGIKITPRAFGKDRRLPITNAYG
jgi:NAD+ synthase (glutamine-hydrolysing)